ncbi:MAG: hypothetical protein AB8G99_25940 [Planctomycetaceae bacterium]
MRADWNCRPVWCRACTVAINNLVLLALSDLPIGEQLWEALDYVLGMLAPCPGFGFAANLFASGEQKRGDRYLCGSLFATCIGIVVVLL